MGGFDAPQPLRDLAYRYAWAVDRRDADAFIPLFTADGAVRGHGENPIDYTGHERLTAMIADLGMFERTMHNVFNQLFERSDDGEVTGLAYCIASHMLPEQAPALVDMAIWYHDRYAEEAGTWKFAERRLEVLWVENRPVKRFAASMMSGSPEALA
jgi:SnoaL-like domain